MEWIALQAKKVFQPVFLDSETKKLAAYTTLSQFMSYVDMSGLPQLHKVINPIN